MLLVVHINEPSRWLVTALLLLLAFMVLLVVSVIHHMIGVTWTPSLEKLAQWLLYSLKGSASLPAGSFTNSFVKLATHTLWHLVTEHCFANVCFISPFPWLMSRFFNHSCFLMVIFHSICSISRVLMFSTCLCLKSLERLSHKAKWYESVILWSSTFGQAIVGWDYATKSIQFCSFHDSLRWLGLSSNPGSCLDQFWKNQVKFSLFFVKKTSRECIFQHVIAIVRYCVGVLVPDCFTNHKKHSSAISCNWNSLRKLECIWSSSLAY